MLLELKALESLARGSTQVEAMRVSGLPKKRVQALRKREDYPALIEFFKDLQASQEADLESIGESVERERNLGKRLDDLVYALCEAGFKSAHNLSESDPEEIPVRLLPQLLKSVKDLVELRRTGEERANGIEGLLEDVASIEKKIEGKVIPISRGPENRAAQG